MARNEWLGNALAVSQISTITFANTWAAADTTFVECNGKRITLTVGTDAATTDVAAALKAALNGEGLVGTESRNTTGNFIPEFTEFTPSVSGSVVTLTGLPGVPFTVTVGETTAGSGTATLATTTAATGPNDADNVANWSLGALPVDGDEIVIASPVSILYGLDAIDDVAGKLLIATSFWSGGATIGLPKLRRVNGLNTSYNEYRPTFLELDGCTAGSQIGIGGAINQVDTGRTLLNIDFGTGNVDLTVLRTGQSNDPSRPALCLSIVPADVANAKLEALGGDIGVGFFGETNKCLPKIGGDARVVFGTGVTIGATFDQAGGVVELNTATTAINKTGGTLTINGTGAHPIVDNFGGSLIYNSTGALGGTRVNVGAGATIDFSKDLSAKTISTALLCAKGATVIDPNNAATLKTVGCRLADISYTGPMNKTYAAT